MFKLFTTLRHSFGVIAMLVLPSVAYSGSERDARRSKKPVANYRVVNKEVSFTKSNDKCDITYSYAFVHGSRFSKGETILNEYVKQKVNEEVKQWNESCSDPKTVSLHELDFISLSIFNERLVLVSESGYSDYSPSAHPGHFKSDYTFDLKRGRPITLGDLFQPGSDQQSFLKDFRTMLKKARDIAWDIDTWDEWAKENFAMEGDQIAIETIGENAPESDPIYIDYFELRKYWNPTDPPDKLLKPLKKSVH